MADGDDSHRWRIWSDSWPITASVKSSMTLPLVTRTCIRCGTSQRPSRLVLLLRQSMRASSRRSATGLQCAAGLSRWTGRWDYEPEQLRGRAT
jgi:hypothetical protein